MRRYIIFTCIISTIQCGKIDNSLIEIVHVIMHICMTHDKNEVTEQFKYYFFIPYWYKFLCSKPLFRV